MALFWVTLFGVTVVTLFTRGAPAALACCVGVGSGEPNPESKELEDRRISKVGQLDSIFGRG